MPIKHLFYGGGGLMANATSKTYIFLHFGQQFDRPCLLHFYRHAPNLPAHIHIVLVCLYLEVFFLLCGNLLPCLIRPCKSIWLVCCKIIEMKENY